MGGALGRRQGLGQDALPDLPAMGPWSTRVRSVGEPLEATLLEATAPQQHGGDRHVQLVGDRDVGSAFRGAQDDPGAHRHALLGGARARHGTQGLGFGLTHGQWSSGMGSHARPAARRA